MFKGRKMAKFYKLAPVTLFAFVFSGCIMTRGDVKEMEQKKVVQDQVQTLQKSTAEQTSKFTEINQDLRELTGRVEVVENKVGQLNSHLKDKQGGDQAVNQALDKRLTALQEEVAKLEGQVVILSQELQAMKTAAAAEPQKASTLDAADDLFDKKEYKKAVLAYQRFRDQNPKSKKLAKATYRIGLCFSELGLKDDAKSFWEDVIAKYPSSEEAKLAKAKLNPGSDEKHSKPKAKKKKDG